MHWVINLRVLRGNKCLGIHPMEDEIHWEDKVWYENPLDESWMETSSFVIMLIEYCVEIGICKVILKSNIVSLVKIMSMSLKNGGISKSIDVSPTRRTSVP